MDAIITIILCIVLVNLIAFLLKKIYIPHVISLILTGLFLGLPFIREALIEPNVEMIFVLGDLGILSSMFLAGLKSSRELLSSERYDSLIISIFATTVPFIMSMGVFILLGLSLPTSLIISVCLSMTAEATNIEVLLFLKKFRTKIGTIITEAGLFDDVFGLVIVSIGLDNIAKAIKESKEVQG